MSGLFDTSTQEKRERVLIGVMVVVVVVVVLPMLYNLFGTKITKARRDREQLQAEVEKLETEMATEEAVKNKLKRMSEESLPTDETYAKRTYQQWLMEQAEDAGFRERRIDPGNVSAVRANNRNLYKRFTFILHGNGTMSQLADFLRRFEKSGYLHLVRKIDPRPVRNSQIMNLTITVEALSLDQAKSERSLPPIPRGRLNATEDERAMLNLIGDRALFSVYTPPRLVQTEGPKGPDPPRAPDFDHSPYCYVTAIVEVDGKMQVRVHVRTEDKVYWLSLDEMFRLGGVRCFVRKIEFDRVSFEAAGSLYTVKVGKSFAEYDD